MTYHLNSKIIVSSLVIDDQRAKQEKKMVSGLGGRGRKDDASRYFTGFACYQSVSLNSIWPRRISLLRLLRRRLSRCWSLLGYVKWLMWRGFIRHPYANSVTLRYASSGRVHFNNNELSLSTLIFEQDVLGYIWKLSKWNMHVHSSVLRIPIVRSSCFVVKVGKSTKFY